MNRRLCYVPSGAVTALTAIGMGFMDGHPARSRPSALMVLYLRAAPRPREEVA
jgi:hypothetical protein